MSRRAERLYGARVRETTSSRVQRCVAKFAANDTLATGVPSSRDRVNSDRR